MNFKLVSPYQPSGDQPEAIDQLTAAIQANEKFQVLLGVTGSGKTYTMANVIERLNRPVLVLTHNKTLVAQLFSEFSQFFPDNAVEYFVSYYDYYQPEAYLPVTNTYIEKDLSINNEIEKLRLRATSSLLSGRRDVIVVASVSCIYGIGNPETFKNATLQIQIGEELQITQLLRKLVDNLYQRTTTELNNGTFRVIGDIVDVFPAFNDIAFRITFFGDTVEELETFEPKTGKKIHALESLNIYPANLFVTPPDMLEVAMQEIKLDMANQAIHFRNEGKYLEAQRIEERVNLDLELIRELGYCSGIENYSRYFDRRKKGQRPFCLLDYFPDDYLMIIDESHVTIPQVKGMFGGDNSRKKNLVDYGFRLPAALDNRPLNLPEFEEQQNQVVYVSATPAAYEFDKTGGVFVERWFVQQAYSIL